MAIRKSNVDLVIRILDQLEGHPNFVKANRIIDELERAKVISIDEKVAKRQRSCPLPLHTVPPAPPNNKETMSTSWRGEFDHPLE